MRVIGNEIVGHLDDVFLSCGAPRGTTEHSAIYGFPRSEVSMDL